MRAGPAFGSRTCGPLAAALVLFILGACTAEARPRAAPDAPPETVVLLHGLGRSALAMRRLAGYLEDAGFRAVRVGYDSVTASLEDILADVSAQIRACCADSPQALHFVGHSLGGLIIRAYLAQERPAQLGRVVLIGTPNQGTPVVDRYRERWWLRLIGETGLSLGTGAQDFPRSLPRPDYAVGVIAGEAEGIDNERILPGPDDGLVPVASTKLAGMADFILIQTGHSRLRTDDDVAAQTVAFLRSGQFAH